MFIVKNTSNNNFRGQDGQYNARSTNAKVYRSMSGVLNSVGTTVRLTPEEMAMPKYARREQWCKKVLPSNLAVYKVNVTLSRNFAPPIRRGS